MSLPSPVRTSTDVLIVGSGGAGLRAAIAAREKGARTLLVSKGPLARSGASPMAGADYTADGVSMREAGFFGEPHDSYEKFFSDIVHQGCFLNNQRLVDTYVRHAGARLSELMAWGLKVKVSDERAVFTPGKHLMDVLLRQARNKGVGMVGDVAAVDLLVTDGRIAGALCLDLLSGEFVIVECPAVVLASGGWHKGYTPVTGTRELTGDGVAMALRAGAAVTNMEFVTFCCNVLLSPYRWRGSIFTYVLSLVCGGELTNALGDAFLDAHDPRVVATARRTEWNKCVFSVATQTEVREGRGTPGGGVYFDRGDMSWDAYDQRVSEWYPGWKYKGADYAELRDRLRCREPVEVGPAAEYFEGGVDVDEHFASTIPGLYAAGECAVSVFGANRVASAITEMLVSGAVAGWAAGEYGSQNDPVPVAATQLDALVSGVCAPLARRTGTSPIELRKPLQVASQRHLGPVRSGPEIEAYLGFLAATRGELSRVGLHSGDRGYNKEWLEALDLWNLLTVFEASARAALLRTESRGVHYRADFPLTNNDSWAQEIVVASVKGELQLHKRRPATLSITPPPGSLPYEEMIYRMMLAHSDVGGHH